MDPNKTNNKYTFCEKAEKHLMMKKVNKRNGCSGASPSSGNF